MSRALFGRVRMTGGGSAGTEPGGQFPIPWLGTEAPFEASGGVPAPAPAPACSQRAREQLCPSSAVLKATGSCQKTTAI